MISSENSVNLMSIPDPSNRVENSVQVEVITKPELTASELYALYSKETAKLALLAQKLQIAKQQERVQKLIVEAGDIDSKLSAMEIDIDAISAEHSTLLQAYEKEDARWKTKLENIEQKLNRARDSDDTALLMVTLKEEIELFKERPCLLETQLAATERFSALKAIEAEESQLVEYRDLICSMEMELSTLKEILDRDEQRWHGANGEESNIHEVAYLKAQLQQEIVTKAAAIKELDELKWMLAPAKVGVHIRNRKLEWEKISGKNEEIMDKGNQAAHQGNALADAYLFQSFYPNRRTDVSNYRALYGVGPDFVWRHQDLEKLLDILDWRCGMKDFCGHSTLGNYENTMFNTLFMAARLSGCNETSMYHKNLKPFLYDSDAGKKLYEGMKVEFDGGLKRHRAYLKSRGR